MCSLAQRFTLPTKACNSIVPGCRSYLSLARAGQLRCSAQCTRKTQPTLPLDCAATQEHRRGGRLGSVSSPATWANAASASSRGKFACCLLPNSGSLSGSRELSLPRPPSAASTLPLPCPTGVGGTLRRGTRRCRFNHTRALQPSGDRVCTPAVPSWLLAKTRF